MRYQAGPLSTAAVTVSLVVAGAPGALAHNHPSGSTDLVTPGIVRVEAVAGVDITLFDDRGVLVHVDRHYDVPLGGGSGFTVNPDGVIVTATGVVRPAGVDPAVYAANRIFAEHFRQKLPADSARHQVAGANGSRLQSCYPPQTPTSTCIVRVTTRITVFPNLDPAPAAGLPGTLAFAGKTAGSPAVVQITPGAASGLPTVPLAAVTRPDLTAVDIGAFTGRPGPAAPVKVQIAHLLRASGDFGIKPDEHAADAAALVAGGGEGGPIVDDQRSDVAGLAGRDGPRVTVATAEDVSAALDAARLTARRGPLDVVYDTALAQYHDGLYTGAIPVLRQVLRMRPDDAVAEEHLRTAIRLRGTGRDRGVQAGPGPARERVPVWVWGAAGVTFVVAGATAGAVLRRRRTRARMVLRAVPAPRHVAASRRSADR